MSNLDKAIACEKQKKQQLEQKQYQQEIIEHLEELNLLVHYLKSKKLYPEYILARKSKKENVFTRNNLASNGVEIENIAIFIDPKYHIKLNDKVTVVPLKSGTPEMIAIEELKAAAYASSTDLYLSKYPAKKFHRLFKILNSPIYKYPEIITTFLGLLLITPGLQYIIYNRETININTSFLICIIMTIPFILFCIFANAMLEKNNKQVVFKNYQKIIAEQENKKGEQ